MTSLSRNLKALREQINLSQTVVADYLGVSHTIVSNYETGKTTPTHEHLTQLADLFDVEIIDLLEENAVNKQINLAFAFRAAALEIDDLKGITRFKQIVKNYLKLLTINESF